MTPKLCFSRSLFQRLKAMKSAFKGCLYGVKTQECILILGFTVSQTLDDGTFARVDDGFNVIKNNLPAGIDFCGYITVGSDELPGAGSDLKGNVNLSQNPILLTCKLEEELKATAGVLVEGIFREIPHETLEYSEILEKLCLLRVEFSANLLVEESAQSIKNFFREFEKKFLPRRLYFHVKGSDIFIGAQKGDKQVTVGNIYSQIKNDGGKSKNKNLRTLNLATLVSRTEHREELVNRSCAKIEFSCTRKLSIPLVLEGVALAPLEATSNQLHDLLTESLLRNLRLVEEGLLRGIDEDREFLLLKPFNAQMINFPHTFLCVWPESVDESNHVLKDRRRIFHKVFGLPPTKPFFRRPNALPQTVDVLLNTHVGLKGALPGWQQHLVQGSYGYYHYMQHNYNDSGWGCAYRSLQTIFSWFKLQGYTEKPIPSHYDIQEALVSMGDKPRAFLGSSQWIGSTEVSLCLEKFLNISSRIMYVQSGRDLADKGTELAMHFESQGTPIMIGGGVLAHTIIGVDYNRETGETKFLILDPHYTGAEDLQTIQQKGFCNWKTANFWDKKTFYNLCMPIRPIEF
uniref:Probable Ufm1-specific protease 2 n=1 Tax=Phlebotomus kandelakii TaxID=1109342 RepID=A0A6B2EL48_9DIPT